MSQDSDVPSQVRIRTGGDNAHRYDAIKRASDFYGRNKTDSVVYACNDVPKLAQKCQKILDRDDLTRTQREEMADTLNEAVRGLSFDVESNVSIDRD